MHLLLYSLALSLLCGLWITEAKRLSQSENIEEYMKALAESKYKTYVLPEPNKGQGSPVDVLCSMYLIDIHKVDDLSMDFEGQFYFRQSWNDSRLAFDNQGIQEIVLNDASKIWTPDLFMVQEKSGFRSEIIAPNVFIRILPSGEVLYSVRLNVKFSCPMDFRKYPHDTQKCRFSVESYGHTRTKLELSWDQRKFKPVSASDSINIMNFEFKCIQEGVIHISDSTGVYTALDLTLTFQRKFGFYVTTLYMPFTILVVLSWLSFWIPYKMIAPRLTLLLVLLYFMINIRSDVNGYIPPTSYTKGSDIWIAVCESLVFACFLEFIAVYAISRNQEKLQRQLCKNDPEAQMQILESDPKANKVNVETSNSTMNVIASRLKRDLLVSTRIDRLSRILFPILFLIFNFIYWIVYCTGY